MSTRLFQKAPEDQSIPGGGQWALVGPNEELAIGCPVCGCHARLQHDVDATGQVAPSLVCPHEPCTFHEYGVLKDWTPCETHKLEHKGHMDRCFRCGVELLADMGASVPPGQNPADPDFKP